MGNESQYSESELKIGAIQSMRESKGNALGLEGNLAWFVIGGIIAGFIATFWGMVMKWSGSSLFLAFVIPSAFSYLFVLIFFKNKPPGYLSDLISRLLNGTDFDTRRDVHKTNPYLETLRKASKDGQ